MRSTRPSLLFRVARRSLSSSGKTGTRPKLASIRGQDADSRTDGIDWGAEADYSLEYAGWRPKKHQPSLDQSARQAAETECTMFFDGGCPLCHKEVAFYKRLNEAENKIEFFDISTLSTPPPLLAAHGVDLQHAMERLHVFDQSREEMVHGARAFLALWERLPYFHMLLPLFRIPGVLSITETAYSYFAQNRLQATGRCNPHNRATE